MMRVSRLNSGFMGVPLGCRNGGVAHATTVAKLRLLRILHSQEMKGVFCDF